MTYEIQPIFIGRRFRFYNENSKLQNCHNSENCCVTTLSQRTFRVRENRAFWFFIN